MLMIEGFLKNLNFQETWESIIYQVASLLDPIRSLVLDFILSFWDKVLDNPLASVITILALIGLPYTLIKAKASSTEANDRLDQLMDEMQDFEFEKPLIDLQEKFKATSNDDSPPTDYDQENSNLSLEIDAADLNNKEGSGPRNLKSDSFAKHLTLDQEATDDFLSADSWNLHPKIDDENAELSSLSEVDFTEDSKEDQIGLPGELDDIEANFANLFYEDLSEKEENDDLVSHTEEDFDEAESTLAETGIEEEGNARHDEDDLQTRMEKAINKLKNKYSSLEQIEDINEDPAPMVSETTEEPPSHEETQEDEDDNNGDTPPPSSAMLSQDENTSLPLPISAPPDSLVGGQEDSLDKSDVITHLKSFQKKLENRFNFDDNGIDKNLIHSPQAQNTFFRPMPKSSSTRPASDETTDKEYQESLESLIFLKDHKKP